MASSRNSLALTVGRKMGKKGCEKCRCGDDIVVFTSWTEQNYGRRFLKCPNHKEQWSCNYFDWIDALVENPMLKELKKMKKNSDDMRRRMKKLERVIFVVVMVNVVLFCKLLMSYATFKPVNVSTSAINGVNATSDNFNSVSNPETNRLKRK
ncbi:uncharacterized protein LOC114711168 [Neltuma alba]|uniref:uncharacterized protein LOC114711168 n=1 Tax=Neltuma alba TaxID=207710 RepID=UPI0010A4ED9B|nr:uncharacterized protein LOC114711168 [Prosopis alba]